MKPNNYYLVSVVNTKWSKIESDIGKFKVAISCLIYHQEFDGIETFKLDSKIFVATEKGVTVNKKTFDHPELHECNEFMKKIYLEINNNNFNIFKFDKSQDFQQFKDWYQKSENDLMLSLEKL